MAHYKEYWIEHISDFFNTQSIVNIFVSFLVACYRTHFEAMDKSTSSCKKDKKSNYITLDLRHVQ